MAETHSPLVSTEWLATHLDAPDIRIIDASWYLPQEQRNARAEYAEGHIRGAVFFDIDQISDQNSSYPHMLPSPEAFSSQMRAMGLGDGHRIIVYDSAGLFSAARVWWMFRAMGHEDIAVLDGGLKKWKAEGRPLSDRTPNFPRSHFTSRCNRSLIRDRQAVLNNIGTQTEQLVDARNAGRFHGKDIEPRPGLRSGHIPGSINLPFGQLIASDGTLKEPGDLRKIFADAGIDPNLPTTTTCGSGVTACILALGLAVLGNMQVPVYDGSWAEWGMLKDMPIET